MARVDRSACPLGLALDVIGDRWTLLILRDMIFRDRRQFRELLQESDEGVTSNVLAARLQALVGAEILTKAAHAGHKQKVVYSLTNRGVELLPTIIQVGAWGAANTDADPATALWFRIAANEGPRVWRQMMGELAARHRAHEPADRAKEPTFESISTKVRAELINTPT